MLIFLPCRMILKPVKFWAGCNRIHHWKLVRTLSNVFTKPIGNKAYKVCKYVSCFMTKKCVFCTLRCISKLWCLFYASLVQRPSSKLSSILRRFSFLLLFLLFIHSLIVELWCGILSWIQVYVLRLNCIKRLFEAENFLMPLISNLCDQY